MPLTVISPRGANRARCAVGSAAQVAAEACDRARHCQYGTAYIEIKREETDPHMAAHHRRVLAPGDRQGCDRRAKVCGLI